MEVAACIILVCCASFYIILFTYPLVILVKASLASKVVPDTVGSIQPVSILIASYNEESHIRDKIMSFLADDEWIDNSEIIVVSAGSTDRTNEILRELSNHPCVRVIIIDEHLSKIGALNTAMSCSRHDILVFSDCRQKMEKGSLKQLVGNFSDESIGTVNSTLINGKQGQGASRIRDWLNKTALTESLSGSSLNVYGALYAQRKTVYRPVPADLLFDDLFVVVSTIVQGKRLVQEKNSIIYDINFESYYKKERIERLTRGLLIFLFKYKKLILQMPLSTLVRFLIFKYLKLLMPFVHILFIICALILVFPITSPAIALSAACVLGILFAVPEIRNFLLLFSRINFYFMTSTLKFLFFKKRGISWQKLEMGHS